MNGSMSVLGFVEPLLENFGSANGELLRLLPEGPVGWVMVGDAVRGIF